MAQTLEQKLKHYRINTSEHQLIGQLLGRPPEGLEWALFSALWSEHCSYKSSRVHLKKFFNRNERVVTGPGENAGIIDLGLGEKIAFKMESHNHPSFIEPYEGAATGVGGILRDIFTMGARPIALANYLCFGDPKAQRMKALVDGVVRGIGGYGNCVGVPTVTGQTEFHRSYNENILVNAMAVGLFVEGEEPITSAAKGPGNWVVYVGAKTGRDGIHGASMASESFDGDSESKKPTIQKGDPFYEKLLIEACLEVIHQNLVVSIQDMGAAGLTSSSFEMASKGQVGLKLDLDHVPLRDSSMTPEDILLSESQERMLLICRPENFEKIKSVFDVWDLDAVKIGEVVKERQVSLSWRGELVCKIDPDLLTENAPLYERPYSSWQSKGKVKELASPVLSPQELKQGLFDQLASVEGTGRSWIYEQYDQRVGARTARDASSSVAALRLDSGRALGLTLGCRTYLMRMDAQVGGMDAVAYPALELSAKGFLPLAVTDCLNFGSPENKNVMSEFVASVESMNWVCQKINAPVISGNVSFYNETQGKNITSTPSTGLVGLRDTLDHLPSDQFANLEDKVLRVRMPRIATEGLWAEMKGREVRWAGEALPEDFAGFQHLIRQLSLFRSVSATKLVGKFGLPYALARMCTQKLGVKVAEPPRLNFHEELYEVLFAVEPRGFADFKKLFSQLNPSSQWSLDVLGEVVREEFIYGEVRCPTEELVKHYRKSWGHQLGFS